MEWYFISASGFMIARIMGNMDNDDADGDVAVEDKNNNNVRSGK